MTKRKKIAIIGGGASGLISGYLLNKNHEITIYEKEMILGGNVRTLNKNVIGTDLPAKLNIENGVLGFSQSYYPNFHKLLHHLETEYHSYKPSISLISGQMCYPARGSSYLNYRIIFDLLSHPNFIKELNLLVRSQRNFKKLLTNSIPIDHSFADYSLAQGLYKDYLQALFMLSFSTPFFKVPALPQSIINPYFNTLPDSTWSFIKGGVYSYLETLLSKSNMRVICNAGGIKVNRKEDSVQIRFRGEVQNYDALIIATTPGSVKELLGDMSNLEMEIFSDWEDQQFKTTAHTDISFYGKFKNVRKTPMDLFVKNNGTEYGYNTYQNDVYRLNANKYYSFSYGLDNVIAKDAILHKAQHTVCRYTKKHDRKIALIKSLNGKNNTFYVGAYLSNGLHEGAVESAMNVAAKLGGIRL